MCIFVKIQVFLKFESFVLNITPPSLNNNLEKTSLLTFQTARALDITYGVS